MEMDIFMREKYTPKKQVRVGHPWPTRSATTSPNLGFPAVGNGVGALVRPSLTAPTDNLGSSRCGNPWSLYAICRRKADFEKKSGIIGQEVISNG